MKELDEIAERRKKLEEVVEKECERRVETMKRLIVCPLSGVFLNTHDNEQRVRDHQMGKQYLGWKRIRELKERLADILRKRAEGKGEENDRVYSKPLGKREDEEEEEEEDRAAAEAEAEVEAEVKPPSEENYRKVAVEEKEAPVKDEEKKTEKKKEALVVVKRRKLEKEDDQKPEAPDEKNILSNVPPPPSSRPFDGAPAAGTTTTTTTNTTNTTMTHVSEEEKVDDNTIKKKEDHNSHPREHHRPDQLADWPRSAVRFIYCRLKPCDDACAHARSFASTWALPTNSRRSRSRSRSRERDRGHSHRRRRDFSRSGNGPWTTWVLVLTTHTTITTITTIVILKVAGAAVLPGRPSRREIGETTVVIGERRETDLDLARQDEGDDKILLDFMCFNGASSSSRLSVKRFSIQ